MSLKAFQVRAIFEAHTKYWEDKQPEMQSYRHLYMTEFWQGDKATLGLVETPRAYEMIESTVASLFAKNPAVVVKPDLRNRGNAPLAQLVTNEFFSGDSARIACDDSLRHALMYGNGAIKLYVRDEQQPEPLARIGIEPIHPWDVVVDDTARCWEDQRFVGHLYLVPLTDVHGRFGRKAESFTPRKFVRYIEGNEHNQQHESPGDADIDQAVLILEFYDIANDALLFWSPDYKQGTEFVKDRTVLETGGDGEKAASREVYKQIPLRTAADTPVVPIIPVTMSRDPDYPLRGYSMLKRTADQFREFNLVRTAQSQAVRKSARQWLVAKGLLDDEAVSKVVEGVDGEIIEVDVEPGADLRQRFVPVPQEPVPADFQAYARQVDEDLQRGTILAPFTRGEATKATATEVQALAAYSATEVGRMARVRDAVIVQVARVYLHMLAVLMGDEPQVLYVNKRSVTLRPDHLAADFAIYAQEAGASPMGAAAKRSEFISLLPVLREAGVPNDKILKQLVELFELSEDILPDEKETSAAISTGRATATGGPAEAQPTGLDLAGAAELPVGPESVQQLLPGE